MKSRRTKATWAVIVALCAAVLPTACATPSAFGEETVGERFRKVMARIDEECRKEKVGPYLDPKDPQFNDKKRYTHCDILKLKPYDPLATEEGRFAHSIKLPPPHDEPKDVYKPGMTGQEYFKALCEAEAGEWVYRRVENVEGIVQVRRYTDNVPSSLAHLILAEDTNGYHLALLKGSEGNLIRGRSHYRVAEIPTPSNALYPDLGPARYHRIVRRLSPTDPRPPMSRPTGPVNEIIDEGPIAHPTSRYAFVQRGVSRRNDVEHGIRGGELIVVDREASEVLAVRRFFVRRVFDDEIRREIHFRSMACPSLSDGYDFNQTDMTSSRQC